MYQICQIRLWLNLRVIHLAVVLMLFALSSPSDGQTIAIVGDSEITQSQLQREWDLLIKSQGADKALTDSEKEQLRKTILEKEINRQLALQFLDASGQGVVGTELDLLKRKVSNELKQRGITLTAHLMDQGLTAAEWEQRLKWRVGWNRYIAKYMNDENYENFFQQNRRQYDGTQLKVAHILIRKENIKDLASESALLTSVKADIESDKLSFTAAATQYSQSPTAKKGGELGWIEWVQPMPTSFTKAAFALKPGGISKPVSTPFGLHLITVLEEKPGNKTWQQTRKALREGMREFLFTWSVDQQREKTEVQILREW